MEDILKELTPFVRKLSYFYGKKFDVSVEDLYQEGLLSLIQTKKKYKNLNHDELVMVLKKVINRTIYGICKDEVERRSHEVSLEEEDYEECGKWNKRNFWCSTRKIK